MSMRNNATIAILCLLLLASCSTTKNLPEGEILYTGIDRLEVVNEDKTEAGAQALGTRLIIMRYSLWMYECANLLASHNLLKVTYDVHVEHIDWQVVLAAHCCGCDVHDF